MKFTRYEMLTIIFDGCLLVIALMVLSILLCDLLKLIVSYNSNMARECPGYEGFWYLLGCLEVAIVGFLLYAVFNIYMKEPIDYMVLSKLSLTMVICGFFLYPIACFMNSDNLSKPIYVIPYMLGFHN